MSVIPRRRTRRALFGRCTDDELVEKIKSWQPVDSWSENDRIFESIKGCREAALALMTRMGEGAEVREDGVLALREALGELSVQDHRELLRVGQSEVVVNYLFGHYDHWLPVQATLQEALDTAYGAFSTNWEDVLRTNTRYLWYGLVCLSNGVFGWLVENVAGLAWVTCDPVVKEATVGQSGTAKERIEAYVTERLSLLGGEPGMHQTLFEDHANWKMTFSEFCEVLRALERSRQARVEQSA